MQAKELSMSLYIRNQDVNRLASQVQQALGVKTKTEAVRSALILALNTAKTHQSFDERNAKALAIADALGSPNPDFDMKAFTDEMWDNM